MILKKRLSRLDWRIVDELRHIPHGQPGSSQELLGREYVAFRSLHRRLGSELQPGDALVQAIHNIRRRAPRFTPRFDAAFFFGGVTTGLDLRDDPVAREIHARAGNGGSGDVPNGDTRSMGREVEAVW